MVVVPMNKYYVRTIGQRQEMSFYDVAKINWNYCNGTIIQLRHSSHMCAITT